MVAFATDHEPGTTTVEPKNRVGNFFVDVPDCIGTTGPQTRTGTGENDRFSYDACRGVSLAQGVQGRIDGRPVKGTPGKHAAITFEIPGEFVTDVNALLDQHGFDPLYRRNGRHYLTISALNVEGELVAIPNYRPDRIGARGNQLSGVFHVPGVNELELASTLIQYSANMNTHNLSYPFAGVTGYNSNSFVYSAITHAGGTISQQPGGRRFFSNPYFHSARFPKHRSLMPSSYFDPNE